MHTLEVDAQKCFMGGASNQKYLATTGLEDRTQRPLGCEYQRLFENGAWSP